MARLPFASKEEFPEELKYVWDAVARGTADNQPPNIFRTMGNNPALLRGYLRLGNVLWSSSGLDVATREMVILRAAILQHSVYEWHQHVRLGRQAGLTNEQMNALHRWREAGIFDEKQQAMLAYVDAVAASDHPGDDAHNELAKHFPPATIVGINLLVGFYLMTAKFLGAMEVEPEEEFVGWELS